MILGGAIREALFPASLQTGGTDGRLDLMKREGYGDLKEAARRYRWALSKYDIQGVPGDVVAAFDADMRRQIRDIQEGRAVYHPTANNRTTARLEALRHLGFEVAQGRYFTRRFPRLAFGLTWIACPASSARACSRRSASSSSTFHRFRPAPPRAGPRTARSGTLRGSAEPERPPGHVEVLVATNR